MARIYVAGPLFSPQERDVLERVDAAIRRLGHEAFLPHQRLPIEPRTTDDAARAAYRFLLDGLESCDAVVAVLDGPDVDAGTCVELGYAHALRRPILGLRTDWRTANEHAGLSLMAFGTLTAMVRLPDWTEATLNATLRPFLDGVPVFAGSLVRDAVPDILAKEGQKVQFRNVSPDRYPEVLKRKVVETARTLERDEWGVEQEHLADLLELLETLIHLRNYDKESLRSIKEGKWRKRGGYERGFLVAEEPKLSSG